MKAEELKTGLWGFKKFSVYQYITSLEESFSSKLLEKDEENRAALVREQQPGAGTRGGARRVAAEV